jgi:outer membrane protein assembly factor BamB
MEEVPESVTSWAPEGPRTVGDYDYEIIPQPNGFHTMHAGPNNADNVWIALAPEMELDWFFETSFYVPEGPTYDNEGNLYFSPLFPQEDVSLVSLDRETGARNWAIPGNGSNAGGGAVLILNDPGNEGQQIIYHATFTETMALRPDGTEIWKTPTGLTLPPVVPGVRSPTHSFGFNYHPRTDSLVAVTIGGTVLAFSRSTGERVAPNYQIPGAPAVSEDLGIPQPIVDASNALTDEVFGKTPSGLSFYETIVEVIFGGGSVVTNFFAIDPTSSLIYVAATAGDDEDGTEDSLSELGAIYALDLIDDGNGNLEFQIINRATFQGGTGSTPSVSEDGKRVYVSDNVGNVIAYDEELNELWRFDVGEPLAASVAVSPDNSELYVVTRQDVIKLIDHGDSASRAWTAVLTAFEDDPEIQVVFQALTPTITANGIAVSVGGGKLLQGRALMLRVGMGLLDRETGVLRSFAEGREESIAVTSVAPNGAICTANSPVRHASGKALYSGLTKDIIGGISCYKPVRSDLLARDATCAAGVRARNAATLGDSASASTLQDLRQIRVLIDQSRDAIGRAVTDDDLEADAAAALNQDLDRAEASLSAGELARGANDLLRVCNALAATEGGTADES